MLAPWDLFARHTDRPFAYLLDRAGTDMWSFAGSDPGAQLRVYDDGRACLGDREGWRELDDGPLEAIAAFVIEGEADVRAEPFADDLVLPRTVGYLAYELGRFTEPVSLGRADPLGMPLAVLSRYDRFDAWHPRYGTRTSVRFRGARTRGPILHPPPAPVDRTASHGAVPGRPGSNVEAAAELAYRRGFERIGRAIRDGEIYQANLSRRISMPLPGSAAAAYRCLRATQPVPNGAFLDLGRWHVLSNSPECFLRVAGDRVSTWPIKGTRPRGADRDEDRRLREALLRDPKEMAEHIMIVDLERNDLGRVCEVGSVAVPRQAFVQSFRTVHHIVSEVRGRLREDCGPADLLRATFPGGSITGAPKIRAMQIIEEIEPTARGVYTGAVGAFNGPRSVDLNIAIRTAIATDGHLSYATGGGIVSDSRLESEYDETVIKARAFVDTMAGMDEVSPAASTARSEQTETR